MSKDEIRKLLGGYATNTLTGDEQKLLFEAAMEDQELFEALADEQSLREMLTDPVVRRELHAVLEEKQSWWSQAVAWFRRPSSLVLAGGLATAVLVTVAVKNITQTPEYKQTARLETPAERQPEAQPTPPAEVPLQQPKAKGSTAATPGRREMEADKDASRRTDSFARDEAAPGANAVLEARKSAEPATTNAPAAPAAAPPPPARVEAPKLSAAKESVMVTAAAPQALSKVRVAVLNFNSVQGSKQLPDAELTKDVASRLNQAPTQYALVDQKEVDRVLAEKNLTDRPLDTQTAASVGRSLGADAVIVGNAAQQAQTRPLGALGGFRQQQQMSRAKTEQKADQQAITAQVIDTRTASNQFTASADSVAHVTAQLAQFKVEGAVTDVTGSVLTVNLGTPSGIKAGDRFQVMRGDQVLGVLRISSTSANYSVGAFTGSTAPQAGDIVRRILD